MVHEGNKAEKKKIKSKTLQRIRHEIKEWARSIFFALLFVIIFNQFFFKAYKVEGISMQPLLQDGQRIFVNRYVYATDPLPVFKFRLPWTHEPERGDVVVFWFPDEPEKSYIKRIIAVPQDKFEIRNGVFYVNNKKVRDDFVPLTYRSYETQKTEIVPKGYYICVGDHRNRSYDSRAWGGVPRKYIIGKALFRYWPLTEMNLVRYSGQQSFFAE